MKGKLKCGTCEKSKPVSSFQLSWQIRNRVCNYCAAFKAVGIYGVEKENLGKRACLRCDKEFLIKSKSNRICEGCKDKEEYRIGSYFSGMLTEVVR